MSPVRFSAKVTKQFMRKIATVSPVEPVKIAKMANMPADSIRAVCKCGIRLTISSTPKQFAERFVAEWWKRHSGPEHGPEKARGKKS